MAFETISRRPVGEWWEPLGLRGPLGLRSAAAEQVLRGHRPVGFAPVTGDADAMLSLDQVIGLIEIAEREAEQEQQRAATDRRVVDEAAFEAAFEVPSADAVVEDGRWAGFTRGDATAWCWNLFQYEPHGFVHPGSQVRAEGLVKLRAGDLPEAFGYPERARELAKTGMTPRQYRRHREALGARTFDPADVRHG